MSVLMIKEPSFWVIDTCTGGFRRRLMLTPRLLGVPPVGGVLTGGGGVASSIPGAVKLTGRKPVVAAVNGVAAGAGFSLALAADLRIAAESASFVQAFVRIGLIPDASSTYFLPRIIGPARAAELMMLGDSVNAARALEIGLVSRVVPDAELASAARDLGLRLARGPRSIGLIKRALNRSLVNDLDAQLGVEEELQAEAASTADFYEGVAAFLEKRQARFNGR